MNELSNLDRHIQEQLTNDRRAPHWAPDEAKRYMADVAGRRQQFERLASRLNAKVIQPRLAKLASYFPGASVSEDEPPNRCTCWFEYSDRFPATAMVAFSIEHDVRCATIATCYDAHMMPMFVKLNEHDRLTLAIDEVNDATVADWVERRLLGFLDTYLRIDSSGRDVGHDSGCPFTSIARWRRTRRRFSANTPKTTTST
jgi:hypothetical protein